MLCSKAPALANRNKASHRRYHVVVSNKYTMKSSHKWFTSQHGLKSDLCNFVVSLTLCGSQQSPSSSINDNLWVLQTFEQGTCIAGWLTLPQPYNHVITLPVVSFQHKMPPYCNIKWKVLIYVSTNLSTSLHFSHFKQKLAWRDCQVLLPFHFTCSFWSKVSY